MSRREIVLLVSRAIAILSAIEALIHLSNLPYQALIMVRQYLRSSNGGPQSHLVPEEWAVIILILVRVIGLFLIAALFWSCGPTIEHALLPTGTQETTDTPQ
jgi:hypothetical protein